MIGRISNFFRKFAEILCIAKKKILAMQCIAPRYFSRVIHHKKRKFLDAIKKE
jgi:hypothetical protein